MKILRTCLLVLLLLAGCRPYTAGLPHTPTAHSAVLPLVVQPFAATHTPLVEATAPVLPASPPAPSPTSTLEPFPTPVPHITLLFTGVIVPARCVQAEIDARNNASYVYDNVRQLIQGADLAVGTLNATLSDYPPHTGCRYTYVLISDARSAVAAGEAGFDVMSVATNHIKNCGLTNCGDRAFFDTLDNLRRVGILPVGAGKDLAEAMQPVVVEVNGVRFGFVSLGQIEPIAFASQDSPGIAVLNEENLRSAIAAARRVSDVVIAMPHWGPEEASMPNWSQRQLARLAVEAGADLVVGNHTHVVQALEEIEGVMVFYGLGNFVFDQDWARDHQQGVILKALFEGKRFMSYELIPTHVDGDGRVHLADAEEAAEVLARITEVSRSLP